MPINFPDIQQLLRLKRIFDPENNPGGPYWNPAREGLDEVENDIFPVGQSNNQPMLDRSMSDMPTFSTPANDEFNRFIGEFPQREQPGKLRRVGAFVAALGSNNPMQTVDDYLNFNYNHKDYILKTSLDRMSVSINTQDPSKTVETKVMSNKHSAMKKITYRLD